MIARFRNFYNIKKSRLSLKRRSAFRTGAKIYLSKKTILGFLGNLRKILNDTKANISDMIGRQKQRNISTCTKTDIKRKIKNK